MTATIEELRAAVEARDEDAIIAWLERSTPSERVAARPVAQRFAEETWSAWVPIPELQGRLKRPAEENYLARGLRMAVVAPSERLSHQKPDPRIATRVGRALGPQWVQDTVNALTAADYFHAPFRLVRDWVRAGLCERPDADWYVLAFMKNLVFDYGEERVAILRADPGLFEHEIWQLFRVQGESDCCLAGMDDGGPGGWQDAFVQLTESGELPRGRVLDEALGTLARDFPQFRAGWFSRLHDALAPTEAEIVARKATYLRLLGSRIAPTVSLAVRAIGVAATAGAISADDLIAHAGPALQARAAKTAKSVLTLLDRAAKREPDHAPSIAVLAAGALFHERASVQDHALKLIERHGSTDDPDLLAAIARAADGVAPTLADRLAPYVAPPEGDDREQLPARAELTSPLEDVSAITPIDDAHELVLACTRLLGDAGDPMEVERVLDGLALSGVAVRATDPALLEPLEQRSSRMKLRRQTASMFWWVRDAEYPAGTTRTVEDELGRVARAWTRGAGDTGDALDDMELDGVPRLAALVYRRFREVVEILRTGRSVQLHSTPTHAGGWIAADTLAARREADPDGAGPADRALAELRASSRDIRTRAAAELPIDVKRIEHPNGWVSHRVGVGPTTNDELRVDAPKRHLQGVYDGSPPTLRLLATLTPSDALPTVALGLDRLGNNLDVKLARGDAALFIEPFLDEWRPIDDPAARLIALSLAAGDRAPRTMALDVVIAGAESGRLQPETLGAAMAFWLTSPMVRPRRWTKPLHELRSMSTAHARYVAATMSAALRGDPSELPQDLGALLDVLAQSLAACGESLTDPDTRAYLCGVTASGKTGRLVRQLLDD